MIYNKKFLMNDLSNIKSVPVLQVAADLGIKVNKFNKSICFIHHENVPSLSFNTKDNYFFWFSCNIGGSVIDLVKQYLRLNNAESIKYLKMKYLTGIDMENHCITQSPESIKSSDTKEIKMSMSRRIEIYEAFIDHCYWVKNGCSFDNQAKEYLLSRNLDEKTLRKFRTFSVSDYLKVNNFLKQTYTPEELVMSGIMSEKGNLIFFDHRIIFPYVKDGWIVHLRGRITGSNPNKSKYLGLKNISSKMFYNIDILDKLKPNDRLFICEGEIDCISLTRLWLNAIAIPGVTNIPSLEEWIKLVPYNIMIAFDNDAAGIKAGNDIKNIFDILGKKMQLIKLKNKDINELINTE